MNKNFMKTVPFLLYYFMVQDISCPARWEILSFCGTWRIVTVLWASALWLYPLLV